MEIKHENGNTETKTMFMLSDCESENAKNNSEGVASINCRKGHGLSSVHVTPVVEPTSILRNRCVGGLKEIKEDNVSRGHPQGGDFMASGPQGGDCRAQGAGHGPRHTGTRTEEPFQPKAVTGASVSYCMKEVIRPVRIHHLHKLEK